MNWFLLDWVLPVLILAIGLVLLFRGGNFKL